MTFAVPLLALRVDGDPEAGTAGMDDNWRAVMTAAGEMNGDTRSCSSFTGTQP